MRIPYCRINATLPRRSSSATNLCFVKYTNDSINVNLAKTHKLFFFFFVFWVPLKQTYSSFCSSDFNPCQKQVSTDMELLIDIYLYITQTNADTVAQLDRRWLELWYGRQRLFTRLLSKKGRMGDRGTERGRNVGEGFPAPSHRIMLCVVSLSLSFSLHPTLPVPHHLASLSQPLPRGAHSFGTRGHTHTLNTCVFVYLDLWKWQNRAEASDMHARLPWIQHPGTPLLFFLFNSYFLTVFYYCYFLTLFEYFGS